MSSIAKPAHYNYEKIYTLGKTGRRLADSFHKHPQDVEKNDSQIRPNHLCIILIFLFTQTIAWQFMAYHYTSQTQKASRILNKNSSFN